MAQSTFRVSGSTTYRGKALRSFSCMARRLTEERGLASSRIFPGLTLSLPTTVEAMGQISHSPVRDHRLHADDLIAVLEKVAKKPACVVGWSSGGNIALAVAVRRPELFSSLVVVEAPFH